MIKKFLSKNNKDKSSNDENGVSITNATPPQDKNNVDDKKTNVLSVSSNTSAAKNQSKVTAADTAKIKKIAGKDNAALRRFDKFWTLFSSLYAVITTSVFIAKGWISELAGYVLAGLLIFYILLFTIVVFMTYRRGYTDKSAKAVKYLKRFLKIFKSLTNITFLVLSAVSMAAVATGSLEDIKKWLIFIVTFMVAILQLALKLTKLFLHLYHRHIAKAYSVNVTRFVDGKQQKTTLKDKIHKTMYK